MSRQPPPPPGGPFGPVGTYPSEPPQPHVHDLAKPAYHASTYEFGSSPDADNVLAATPVSRADNPVLRVSVLGLLGAILIAVSGFVSWTAGELAHAPTAKPTERPLRWLWDIAALATDSPKMIVAIGVAAALALIGALVTAARWLVAVGGIVAVVVAGLHIKQLKALNLADTNFLSLVGSGAWICLGGGLLAIVASLLGRRSR